MSKRRKKAGDDDAPTPKPQDGDEGRGHSFVAPDRGDVIPPGEDDRPGEIIDLRPKQKIDVGHGGDDSAADDARAMASEDGDDEPATVQRGGLKSPQRARPAAKSDEDASYSRKVKARINREIALRREREAELLEERAANQRNNERIAKLERAQTDIAGNTDVKALEQKLADLKSKLEAAIEDGKTAEQLDLQIQITDVQSDIKLKKYDLEQQRKSREKDDAAEAARQKEAAANGRPLVGKDRTEDWMEQNSHWWGRKAHSDERKECIELDKDILKEIKSGDLEMRPYSEEHFEELATRLQEKYPDLEIVSPDGETYEFGEDGEPEVTDRDRDRDARDTRDTPQRRAPMGGMGGRNGRREQTALTLARGGKVLPTEKDYAEMRMFGIDPNDPAQKKAWAKERVRTLLTEERRGTR